jgi:predicted transcriptional regulator
MPRRKTRTLTELELHIMQLVWQQPEVSVGDLRQLLHESGRPLTEPSIRTMLSILARKGYVKRSRAGRGYRYRAALPAEQATKSILNDLVERVFEGSASALVAALVSQGMVTDKDLAKAKRLIRDRDEGRRP